MIERFLPSGSKLEITLASFQEANALQKIVAKELIKMKLDSNLEFNFNFFKDLICIALASDEFERALKPCIKRCLYREARITEFTFEEYEARQDYNMLCFEVAKENLLPFVKGLSSLLKDSVEEKKVP